MLIDISTANPPFKASQKQTMEELKKRMSARPAVARFLDAAANKSGIDNRYFVVPDVNENAKEKFFSNGKEYIKPPTKERMDKYEYWSKELAINAVSDLLSKNKIYPELIDRLITISCTGFFAPGLDYHLINKLNIPNSVKRTNIGFMGCAASLIGFNSVLESLNSNKNEGKYTLMVSVELCSLHLQIEPTKDNILANTIFADGCAAALFAINESSKINGRLKLDSTHSTLFEDSANYMGWKVGNFGFEMMLSSDLPKIILEVAVPKLKNILQSKGIEISEIKHWALHPGGRAILDSLQKGIGLTEKQMLHSRNVLKNYGNMSSASILFVIKEIIKNEKLTKDELLCAVAFGPGLTMEVAILKGV